MLAVGKVEHPEACVDFLSDSTAAHRAIKVSASQLGFAKWIQVTIRPVIFEKINDLGADAKRAGQLLRSNKFRLSPEVWYSGNVPQTLRIKQPTGRLKPGRAVLPLVIAVWREFQNFKMFALVLQNMSGSAVDFGVPSSAFLVMKSARISNAGKHQVRAERVPQSRGFAQAR